VKRRVGHRACRSQWPCSPEHEMSSLAQTLESYVRIPLEAGMFAFFLCLCCSVYRQRLYDGLIPRPRSPTDWVDQETKKKRPRPKKRTVETWEMRKAYKISVNLQRPSHRHKDMNEDNKKKKSVLKSAVDYTQFPNVPFVYIISPVLEYFDINRMWRKRNLKELIQETERHKIFSRNSVKH
jgi:hypothetical protein